MSIFDEFKGFWGTGAELSERAKVLSKAMGLKAEKLTERLIRYYAAEGVLDKPDRLGREAAYHFRHLLQLLIARRLIDEGVSLVAISKFNLNKSTDELEQALLKPSKEEAKAVKERYREEVVVPKDLPVLRAQPEAMSDVMFQIKEMKQNMLAEAQELQKTRYQIESLVKNLTETQYEFYKRMENEQVEMRHMVMSTLERMAQMVERQNMEFEEQMAMLKKQATTAQEEVLFLLSKHQEQQQRLK
jgi:DNA-binding transcriptional MerR regulator